jgi:DNA polymerase-3 subunit delta'
MNTAGIIGHTRQLKILELLRSGGSLPGTMLFSGRPGIGKKLIARRLLASLFCGAGDPPCLTCPVCQQIAGGTFPDLIELRPDEKGTIPIGSADRSEAGSVRWLIDRLSKKSVSGSYGVLIDGAECISTGGQNALLKTIEEPQEGAHIIIITANKSLILPTILSRCMDLSFNPLSSAEVLRVLEAEGSTLPGSGLITDLSGGSVEAALFLADEAILSVIGTLCRELSAYLNRGESLILDMTAIQKKITMDQLLTVMLNAYRTMLVAAIGGAPLDPFLDDIRVDDREKLAKLIKILLALRKGLANNLNIRGALKGMLYSIESIDELGLPRLDRAE